MNTEFCFKSLWNMILLMLFWSFVNCTNEVYSTEKFPPSHSSTVLQQWQAIICDSSPIPDPGCQLYTSWYITKTSPVRNLSCFCSQTDGWPEVKAGYIITQNCSNLYGIYATGVISRLCLHQSRHYTIFSGCQFPTIFKPGKHRSLNEKNLELIHTDEDIQVWKSSFKQQLGEISNSLGELSESVRAGEGNNVLSIISDIVGVGGPVFSYWSFGLKFIGGLLGQAPTIKDVLKREFYTINSKLDELSSQISKIPQEIELVFSKYLQNEKYKRILESLNRLEKEYLRLAESDSTPKLQKERLRNFLSRCQIDDPKGQFRILEAVVQNNNILPVSENFLHVFAGDIQKFYHFQNVVIAYSSKALALFLHCQASNGYSLQYLQSEEYFLKRDLFQLTMELKLKGDVIKDSMPKNLRNDIVKILKSKGDLTNREMEEYMMKEFNQKYNWLHFTVLSVYSKEIFLKKGSFQLCQGCKEFGSIVIKCTKEIVGTSSLKENNRKHGGREIIVFWSNTLKNHYGGLIKKTATLGASAFRKLYRMNAVSFFKFLHHVTDAKYIVHYKKMFNSSGINPYYSVVKTIWRGYEVTIQSLAQDSLHFSDCNYKVFGKGCNIIGKQDNQEKAWTSIRVRGSKCLMPSSKYPRTFLVFKKCSTNSFQWTYKSNMLRLKYTFLCLDVEPYTKIWNIVLNNCNQSRTQQYWKYSSFYLSSMQDSSLILQENQRAAVLNYSSRYSLLIFMVGEGTASSSYDARQIQTANGMCLQKGTISLLVAKCNTFESSQYWKYIHQTGQIQSAVPPFDSCIGVNVNDYSVHAYRCDSKFSSKSQSWSVKKLSDIQLYNTSFCLLLHANISAKPVLGLCEELLSFNFKLII